VRQCVVTAPPKTALAAAAGARRIDRSSYTMMRASLMRILRWSIVLNILPWTASCIAVPQLRYDQVLLSKPNLARGGKLFETCAACHGERGSGPDDGTIPAIAGEHYDVIVRELVNFRYGRRWDPRMEHFTDEHHLTGPKDIADVAAFVSGMPVTRASGRGGGENLPRGKKIYGQVCSSCHGPAAEGGERYPRLAGQHYEYLLRQMHNMAEGRRHSFQTDHVNLLERFDLGDFADVADYLSRLGN